MSRFVDSLENRRLFDGGNLVGNFRSENSDQPVSTVHFKGQAGQTVQALEVLADSGGRVYVVGRVGDSIQIHRTTRTGLADGSFGNGRGLAIFPADAKLFAFNHPGGTDVALDSADRLYVLIGDRITRFTASGKLDTTFGDRGNFTLTGMAGAKQLAIDLNNRIYVAGSITKSNGDTQFAVARLRSRGSYDPEFNGRGILAVPLDPAAGLPAISQGPTQGEQIRIISRSGDVSIVAVGSVGYHAPDANILSDQNYGIQVVRLFPSGQFDPTYVRRGVFTRLGGDAGTTQTYVTPLAIQGDGKVYFKQIVYTPGTNTFSDGGIKAIAINGKSFADSTIRRSADPGDNQIELNRQSFLLDNFAQEYLQGGNNQLFRLKPDRTVDQQKSQIDFTFGQNPNAAYIFPIQKATIDNSDGTLVTAYKSSRALSLNVARYFADDRPIAQLAIKPALTAATSIPFSVIYAADDGLKPELVDGNEVRVISPDGKKIIKARLTGKTIDADGTVLARYRVADADGWTAADNGTWAVRWIGGTVTSANTVSNGVRTLGNLTVAIT